MVSHEDRCYLVSGTGGWKTIQILDENGSEIETKKFRKTEFNEIMEDEKWGPIVDVILRDAMIKKMGTNNGVEIDTESYEEIRSLNDMLDFDESDL